MTAWLAMLMNKYPNLAEKVKKKLMYYVRITERKARAEPGTYWYRPFRPDDPGIGGTANTFFATFTASTREHLLAQATALTVPTANAYVSFGWYIDFDPGNGGYVEALKQNVIKSQLPARMIYQSPEPAHMYLDFDHVIFGEEQDLIDFIVYQAHDTGNDQIGFALPIMFRIGSRSALNLLPGG